MMLIDPYRFAPAAVDPYWSNVVSLLNFIGPNGSTSVPDDRGLIWSPFGNAQITTAQYVNGQSSLLMDGTGDYIQTPDAAVMRTDVSIFTVEAFVRLNASKLHTVFNKRATTSAQEMSCYINAATNTVNIQAYSAGSQVLTLTSSIGLTLGQWHHIEVGRDGVNWYLFVDGNLEASGAQTGAPQTNTQPFRIGRDGFNTGRDLNGWVGGFRRTNGVIRHMSNFTPPTAPFPTS